MTSTGGDSPEMTRREMSRRRRVQDGKQAIEWQIQALAYERSEINSELRKFQTLFIKRLGQLNAKMQQVTDRQRNLLKDLGALLELDGKCSAVHESQHVEIGHLHLCSLEFEHGGRHLCLCGSKFLIEGEVF